MIDTVQNSFFKVMSLHQKAPLSSSERGFLFFMFIQTAFLTHPAIPKEEDEEADNAGRKYA